MTIQELATAACRGEGGKEEVNVAQACDLLKAALEYLATKKASEVMALVEQYGE